MYDYDLCNMTYGAYFWFLVTGFNITLNSCLFYWCIYGLVMDQATWNLGAAKIYHIACPI